jgi:hypothetical protein
VFCSFARSQAYRTEDGFVHLSPSEESLPFLPTNAVRNLFLCLCATFKKALPLKTSLMMISFND